MYKRLKEKGDNWSLNFSSFSLFTEFHDNVATFVTASIFSKLNSLVCVRLLPHISSAYIQMAPTTMKYKT